MLNEPRRGSIVHSDPFNFHALKINYPALVRDKLKELSVIIIVCGT